jgi:hypothetical protein
MINAIFADKRQSAPFLFPRPYRAERVYFGPPEARSLG